MNYLDQIWNLRQIINQLLRKPPIDCHYYQNPPRPHLCFGCQPGQTFKCEQCGRLTSWCNGGDGDELCDSCWSENQPEQEPETEPLTLFRVSYKITHLTQKQPEND